VHIEGSPTPAIRKPAVSALADGVMRLHLHWPVAVVALVGAVLIFTNLDKDYLWADEGDTAVFASNILKFGVPKAWDGVTFVDSDKGARLNHELVLVTSPWIQYYATAASFLVFGTNTLSARLPFALAGWLTVVMAYRVVWQANRNRWAAFSAAAMLGCSVQFLLYCRQCRYYALSMLLTVLLLQIFLTMKSVRRCALFAATSIVMFHTHPIGAVLVGALGALTLVYRPFAAQRRWLWIALPIIAVFTLPWSALAGAGYSESMGSAHSGVQFSGRIVQFMIETASVTPLVGALILLSINLIQKFLPSRKRARDNCSQTEARAKDQGMAVVIVTFTAVAFYALTIAATQPADSLWRIGIRYSAGTIPLIAMATGILIARVGGGRAILCLPLLLVLIFTKVGQLTPWIFWGERVASFDGKEVIEAHLPSNLLERYLNTRQQLIFLFDLFEENPGTVSRISRFLQKHAQPDDRVITNYEWEPLYFHTRLAQALKILPDYPIWHAAKQKGLPDYVFDVNRTRWIIWRPIWEGYQEYSAIDVEQQIVAHNGSINLAAELPESLWENREDIHFHRFSGERYLFHERETFPAAKIFQVTWPVQ
jgi:Dolichyl-phosphate-mannose-protein mannosyltransferase